MQKAGKKVVILNLIQDLVVHCKQGFTLIELLVVVLIVAVLAAIALPQYQRVIERSKAMQVQTLLKTIGEKGRFYYLEKGVYPASWTDLDINLNWAKTSSVSGFNEALANEDWILEQGTPNFYGVAITRKKGPYKGGGFIWFWSQYGTMPSQQILCFERNHGGEVLFANPADRYCKKIFGGTNVGGSWLRYYTLP